MYLRKVLPAAMAAACALSMGAGTAAEAHADSAPSKACSGSTCVSVEHLSNPAFVRRAETIGLKYGVVVTGEATSLKLHVDQDVALPAVRGSVHVNGELAPSSAVVFTGGDFAVNLGELHGSTEGEYTGYTVAFKVTASGSADHDLTTSAFARFTASGTAAAVARSGRQWIGLERPDLYVDPSPRSVHVRRGGTAYIFPGVTNLNTDLIARSATFVIALPKNYGLGPHGFFRASAQDRRPTCHHIRPRTWACALRHLSARGEASVGVEIRAARTLSSGARAAIALAVHPAGYRNARASDSHAKIHLLIVG